jgi:hypothetical protein
MPISEKPKKKRTQVVAMPLPTPYVQVNKQPQWFPIDWNKVETLEDIKVILKNMGLGCQDNAPNYQELKKYLSDIPTQQ